MAKAPRSPKGRAPARGKAGARTSSTPRKEAAPRRPSGGIKGKTYEVVCSECYTPFAFRADAAATAVACPECLHVGSAGAKDVMSKIAIAKTAEQGNLLKALIPGILFVLCGFAWVSWLTAKAVAHETASAGVNYGFLGATLILLILAIGLGLKYESNRYEVYF